MGKPANTIIALLFTFLWGATSFADVVKVELAIPEPELWEDTAGFTHVGLTGFLGAGLPGTPNIPSKTLQILLPPGQKVEAIDILPSELIEVAGTYTLFPVQKPLPIGYHGPVIFTQPDVDIYTSDDAYPDKLGTAPDTQLKRGFIIQPVVISPIVYRPASGRLGWYPWITVTITTSTDKTQAASQAARYRGFERDFVDVAGLLSNPDALAAYNRNPAHTRADDYRYVIVTNQALAGCSGADNLQALAADKNARGISTLIETMEDIRTGYSGQDDAEKVRNFIKDMYDNHGADFVLLAGDDDLEIHDPGPGETEATIVPVRGMYVSDGYGTEELNLPSDVYYACLDGNFNSDGDNRYGETSDNADLLSEVWVGRAPVDNCTEVTNFVTKTLAYQADNGTWLKNVYMVGEWLWEAQPSFGKDYLAHVANSSTADGIDTKGFSESSFFTVSGLYDKDQSGPNCDYQPSPCWDTSDVLAVLNGNNHIINHLGHSYTYYNLRLTSDQLDGGISNVKPFFEYSQGCYCGAFDNRLDPQENNEVVWQDSFAEHMVLGQHGAFAAVMNTRYGFGTVSNYFNRTFWDGAFRNGTTRLGELQAHGREMLSGNASNPYFRWVYYETTLFGDPEVSIHLSSSSVTPQINLSETELWFVAIENGANPNDQTITLNNTGGGTLNWSVTSDRSWLTGSPASGTAPSDIVLSVDATGLAADYYEATLTFEAPGADNSPFEQTVALYVVTIPSSVAPYSTGSAPVVDGTIGAGEYTGASTIQLGSWDDLNNTVKVLHDGDKLYMAFDIPSDIDADDSDYVRIYIDGNADELWPTAAGDEGLFVPFGDGSAGFWAFWNDGSGVQSADNAESPVPGMISAWGMSAGHRVFEVSLSLTSGHLSRAMGDPIGMFLYYEDYVSDSQTDPKAMWPYAIGSLDSCEFFGDVILGTDTDSLVVNPASLGFAAVEDGEPAEWSNLTIGGTTTNALNFTVSKDANWIATSETSGTTPAMIRVWADPTGVSAGGHSGTLTVTVAGVDSVGVPVSFDVAGKPPVFSVIPTGLVFEADKGAGLPASQNINITNASGSGSLIWSAATTGGWFTLSAATGTAPSTISVRPDTTDLSAGYHAGTITLTAAGAEPFRVDLLYNINVPPVLALEPQEIVRQDPLAGGPVEIELKVKNAQPGTMTWSVNEFSPWITLTPTGGTAINGHPGRVTVTLDPASLGAGLHEADISVMAPDAVNSPQTLHVAWTLVDAAALAVTPASLSFEAQPGGANPAAQNLQISNAGPGAMSFSVSCADSWLSCSPASGSAPASVAVSVNIAGLSEGLHNGSVVVSSAEAANSPLTVPVSLNITSGGNTPPPAPVLISPPHQAVIVTDSPELTIQNVADPNGDKVTYSFEVYEKGSSQPSVKLDNIIEGQGDMTYTNLNATLADGITYQWRAKAVDSHAASGPWSDYWEFTIKVADGGGGCGCASGGNAGSGGTLFMLFILGLALTRRWKR